MQRPEFDALLHEIADDAEEWLTSAEALRMTRPQRVQVVQNGNGHSRSRWESRMRSSEWELYA
jgi:hypothetical protein